MIKVSNFRDQSLLSLFGVRFQRPGLEIRGEILPGWHYHCEGMLMPDWLMEESCLWKRTDNLSALRIGFEQQSVKV